MLTLSNGLSFIRAPLAFLFLQGNPKLRFLAILLAMITDSTDGYFARKNRVMTRFGAILDPAMDKFFVYFGLATFFLEGKIALWQVVAMLSRDIALCLYGIAMLAMRRWKEAIVFRSIRWGKVATALQFIVLLGLVMNYSFPSITFTAFILMGGLALIELFQSPVRTPSGL